MSYGVQSTSKELIMNFRFLDTVPHIFDNSTLTNSNYNV